ncbi:MAG: hypothetical protein R3Y49_05590 [Rikenellaceae bacterium]
MADFKTELLRIIEMEIPELVDKVQAGAVDAENWSKSESNQTCLNCRTAAQFGHEVSNSCTIRRILNARGSANPHNPRHSRLFYNL